MAETHSSDRPPLAEPRSGVAIAPARTVNPFSAGEVAAGARGNALISVEQQKAIAEVQARIILARANPRDPVRAVEAILNDCTRPTLAERAVYEYARGGTDIRGPSIRLAEAIAQRWGNIASGFKEVARLGEHSECVAYAWDLETGFYDERQFQVRHWRDTRQGGYQVTDERDIYELVANFAQRRKRAVLLAVIPGDVTEAALEQCERTLASRADTSPEAVGRLIAAFGEFGVTPQQIETRIQRRLAAIRPAQMVQLRNVYNSLRDGMSEAGDWFGETPAAAAASAEEPDADRGAAPREGGGSRQAPPAPENGRRRRRAATAAPTAESPPAARAASATAPPAAETTTTTGPRRRVQFDL